MKIRLLLILAGAALILQSCATTPKMTAVSSSDQKVGYDGTIVSQKKHFISLSPYTQLQNWDIAESKTLFMLVIENEGTEPLDISNENISVVFQGNTQEWASRRIKVQSFEDFMEDLDEEYRNNEKEYIYETLYDIKQDSEISSMMSSSSDSSSSDSSSSSSSSSDVESQIDQMNEEIKRKRENNDMIREALNEIVLKPQSIMPNTNCSGIIVFNTDDMEDNVTGNFYVTISLDGEEYRFTFNRSI